MGKLVAIACFLAAFAIAVRASDCGSSCNHPTAHYEEFGCQPQFEEKSKCCPKSYNCTEIISKPENQCFYKGKVFEIGDSVDSDLTYEVCMAACRCVNTAEDHEKPKAEFLCAHVDCPEFFGNYLQPNCIRQYEMGKCCSQKQTCEPFDGLATCQVDETTYKEGQRFYVDDKCLTCVCQPGFNGEFSQKFCSKISCGLEVRDRSNLKNHCAPVYSEYSKCCPFSWQCPDGNEVVVSSAEPRPTTSDDMKCRFGSKTLLLGDSITYDEASKVVCTCQTPPLLTCLQSSPKSK